jgi:DNA-binding CsgD family transcriptional regulator
MRSDDQEVAEEGRAEEVLSRRDGDARVGGCHDGRVERRVAPLTGRDEQLGRLREAVRAARSGVPGTVLVEGEAGIGKTRLVSEVAFEESAHGAVVLWGNCSAVAGRDVPLGPFIDALGDLRRELDAEVLAHVAGSRIEVLAGLAPGAFDVAPSGPVPALGQVFGAVTDVLRATAVQRPVLLLLEDVHWADDSTLDLVDYLARSVRTEQLLVVVTARTDDVAYQRVRGQLAEVGRAPGVVRLVLPRLTSDQVADQVRALGGRGDPAEVDRVVELSGGVPFLVEQVVEAGVEQSGALASRLLGHRIDGLSPDARTLVDAASVALSSPRAGDVASVVDLGPDELDRALRNAVREGVLVVRGESIGFRHALLQEAALEDLLPLGRQELHRRWAEVLSSRSGGATRVIEIAHHRIGAGDPGPALDACLAAAAHAGRVSAYVERDRMLARALDLWPQVPDAEERSGTDLPALLSQAAESAQLVQHDVRAADLVARARDLLPASAPAERRAWLDVLDHWRQGNLDHAAPPADACRAAAAFDGLPPSRRQALAFLVTGGALAQHGDLKGSLGFAGRALDTARRLENLLVEAKALTMTGLALSGLGRDREAMESMRAAVVAADRCGDLDTRANVRSGVAVVAATAGLGSEATAASQEAIELLGGDRPGPLSRAWMLHSANLAEELCESGEWDEAHDVMARARDCGEDEAQWMGGPVVRLWVELLVWRGERNIDLAWTECLKGEDLDGRNLQDLVWGHLSWADIASRLGATSAARGVYRSVLADDRTTALPDGTFRVLAVAARTEADIAVAGQDPDPDEAAWAVERIGSFLAGMTPRNPRHAAYAASASAHLLRCSGDDDRATWSDVVGLWREAHVPHELGWALVRLAVAELEEARRAEAVAALTEARAIAARLRATPLADAADTVARRARLPVSGGPELPFGLTPRELEVLRLVADGASNSEIGRRLSISSKTASVHVTHILQKLDVHTRGEAAAVAHRAEIWHGSFQG